MTKNLNLFVSTYKEELQKNCTDYPWYRCCTSDAEREAALNKTAINMTNAIQQGTFNKDSATFKAVCKKLKIRHTYIGIKEFIETKDVA